MAAQNQTEPVGYAPVVKTKRRLPPTIVRQASGRSGRHVRHCRSRTFLMAKAFRITLVVVRRCTPGHKKTPFDGLNYPMPDCQDALNASQRSLKHMTQLAVVVGVWIH